MTIKNLINALECDDMIEGLEASETEDLIEMHKIISKILKERGELQ